MKSSIRPALVLFLLLTLITGVVYPLLITGGAQAAFSHEANGSIVTDSEGKAIGSRLIGQEFGAGEPGTAACWFWGRPSATVPAPFTSFDAEKGTGSSGSNLGPTNPALMEGVKARIAALAAADAAAGYARLAGEKIPVDLVTASGSGLDPHISPAAAEYQIPRVAKARHLSEELMREAVRRHTAGRTFGVLGEPVVDVAGLNRWLGGVSR